MNSEARRVKRVPKIQPTPRAVPIPVSVMLLGGGLSSMLVVCSLLLVLSLLALGPSLPRYYHFYSGARATTQGEVVDLFVGQSGQGYTFSYNAGGDQYVTRGYGGALTTSYQKGQKVRIDYSVSHPEIAALPGLHLGKVNFLLLAGLLCLFVYLLVKGLASLVEGARIKRLLTEGRAADARLESDPTGKRYIAHFQAEGESEARAQTLPWKFPAALSKDVVLYSPTDPSNLVPLSALKALLRVDDHGALVAERPALAFLPPLLFIMALALSSMGAYYLDALGR